MIKHVYKTYFQKSRVFLFPLLEIKKASFFKPISTYVTLKDFATYKDRRLIVTYETDLTENWATFHKEILLKNKLFDKYYVSTNKTTNVYIFDLNYYKEEYDYFIQGLYSQFSPKASALLRTFFNPTTPEWAYMETFLIPEKAFAIYANLLDVKESLLRDSGELCTPPDLEKEHLDISLITTIN